jgi:hypothetical protein
MVKVELRLIIEIVLKGAKKNAKKELPLSIHHPEYD